MAVEMRERLSGRQRYGSSHRWRCLAITIGAVAVAVLVIPFITANATGIFRSHKNEDPGFSARSDGEEAATSFLQLREATTPRILGSLSENVCGVKLPLLMPRTSVEALPTSIWVSVSIDTGLSQIRKQLSSKRVPFPTDRCTKEKLTDTILKVYVLWLYANGVALENPLKDTLEPLEFLINGAVTLGLANSIEAKVLDMKCKVRVKAGRLACEERDGKSLVSAFARSLPISRACQTVVCSKLLDADRRLVHPRTILERDAKNKINLPVYSDTKTILEANEVEVE